MSTVPFYEAGYIPTKDRKSEIKVDLDNPKKIYDYLRENVYKQDEYCREAAIILYNHIRGITSRNIVCGPPGCGKTLVWECLKKIWPRIMFVDSSTLTKSGWKGDNNVAGFLSRIDIKEPDYIVVFDEFDKCVRPQITSSGENVSASVQSEFLKIVEGCDVRTKDSGGNEYMVDTSKISFVFCGSFAERADQISERDSSSGFGFGVEKYRPKAFENKLEMKDVIEFGIIPELASRTTRIINVRPLTEKDYRYLISDHPASPVKKLERIYKMELKLTKKRLNEIARDAYESGLGIRNVTAILQQIIDDKVFDSFPDEETGSDLKGENYVF